MTSARSSSMSGISFFILATRGHGKQIALWAYKLSFNHPITKENLTFECLPEKVGTWKILE